MKKPEAPCLFCDEKEVGCHIDCDKYKAFKKAQEEYNEVVKRGRLQDSTMRRVEIKRFRG